jgi:hypothetical protein
MCQAITHMQSILYREVYFDVVYMSNEGRHIVIYCTMLFCILGVLTA